MNLMSLRLPHEASEKRKKNAFFTILIIQSFETFFLQVKFIQKNRSNKDEKNVCD